MRFPLSLSLSLSLSVALALGSFFILAAPLAAQASFYPGQTTDPGCLPSDATCIVSSIASSTASSIPYYAANGSVLSATSTLQILPNGTASTTGATLNGTTTNGGTISGGTVTSHITQHCTTITDGGGTVTTLPNETTNSFPLGAYTLVKLDTVLMDPDGAADTANSQIKVPSWAGHVQVWGHLDFSPQNNGNGYASVHLFRNNAPTTADAFYHVRVYYPKTATSTDYVTAFGTTPVIPVQGANETWQMYGWQDSGASVDVSGLAEWFGVCFYP